VMAHMQTMKQRCMQANSEALTAHLAPVQQSMHTMVV